MSPLNLNVQLIGWIKLQKYIEINFWLHVSYILDILLFCRLMNNNNFNGDFLDVPSTLQILDISNNKFDGNFPTFNTSNCSLSLKYL